MTLPKVIREDVLALAAKLGISERTVMRHHLTRPMTDDARLVIANRLKGVSEPHSEPMVIGRGGATLTVGSETVTLTIRKQPVPETADLLALRRAAEKAS